MKRSTCSHPDVLQPMQNPEAALHTSHDLLFERANNDAHDYIPIPAWEAASKEESLQITAVVAVTVHAEAPGEVYHRSIESRCNENDYVMRQEVNPAIKELMMNHLRDVPRVAGRDRANVAPKCAEGRSICRLYRRWAGNVGRATWGSHRWRIGRSYSESFHHGCSHCEAVEEIVELLLIYDAYRNVC